MKKLFAFTFLCSLLLLSACSSSPKQEELQSMETPADTALEVETKKVELQTRTQEEAPKDGLLPFKRGYYVASRDCNIRSLSSTEGKVLGKVKKGKLLWVEDSSDKWAKVFLKKGHAFVFKGCL